MNFHSGPLAGRLDRLTDLTGGATMSWSVEDMPDQSGRVAVVTGANGGLGFATAQAIAARGAHVALAARDLAKAERARDHILTATPHASLDVVHLDLGDLGSVHAAADAILADHDRVDILVNNAGVMATPESRTTDGFELQIGVNHLGHFVLTARLLGALARGRASRVVAVTSTGRHIGRVLQDDDPYREGRYKPWRAYGDSKLANLLFAVELDRRLREAGARVASLVAHPGLSATDLQRTSMEATQSFGHRFWYRLATTTGMHPERGALPQLRAATDPRARGGELYTPRFVTNGPPVRRPLLAPSRSRRRGRQLWAVSEAETGMVVDVATLVGARS
jgi:NAD(P)-dependent dehydrogenase (short-subunit alcohol dehydrogenase family)